MKQIVSSINNYLELCEHRKKLSAHTVRAYRIDMAQFISFLRNGLDKPVSVRDITKQTIKSYIQHITEAYAPRTCKRKIATLKAYFNYLEFEDVIGINPMRKVDTRIKEPQHLPKSLSLKEMETLLRYLYQLLPTAKGYHQKYDIVRCIAYLEIFFATGLRVGELCSLSINDVNLTQMQIRVLGKGGKERIAYLETESVKKALHRYLLFREKINIKDSKWLLLNRNGGRMKEDGVRRNMKKHASRALVGKHVTPHMLRHTFAILLLEEGVDVRYIQELLGHSSITTTQIYLRLTNLMLRMVLQTKHPRGKLVVT